MKEEDEIILSRQALTQVQRMVLDVPQPTVAELQKLLAIQGSILNSLGIALVAESNKFQRLPDKKGFIRLAIECLRESRYSLESAAKIEINPKESSEPQIQEENP